MKKLLILLPLLAILTACALEGTAPAATNTPAPPTATVSLIPAPTQTPEPTFTPTPEPDPWEGYGVNDIGWMSSEQRDKFDQGIFDEELQVQFEQFRKDSISDLSETNPQLFTTIMDRLVESKIIEAQNSPEDYIEQIQKLEWVDMLSTVMIHNQETQVATILTPVDIRKMETQLSPSHVEWVDPEDESRFWYGGFYRNITGSKTEVIELFNNFKYTIPLLHPDQHIERQGYVSSESRGDYYGYTFINSSEGKKPAIIVRLKDGAGEVSFRIFAVAIEPQSYNENNSCFVNLKELTQCPVKTVQTIYRIMSTQGNSTEHKALTIEELTQWLSYKGPRIDIGVPREVVFGREFLGFNTTEGLVTIEEIRIGYEDAYLNSP